MDVRITTRRATVGDSFLRYIKERVAKLDRFEPRLQAVDVMVDEDRGKTSVEARADVPGAPPMIARADAGSERTALDGALQKLGRQLRRRRGKRRSHQAPSMGALAEE